MARPMAADSFQGVGRVIKIGQALYVTLPKNIAHFVGLKQGDRVAMETDGQSVIFAKVPFEELINQRVLRAHRAQMDRERKNSGVE